MSLRRWAMFRRWGPALAQAGLIFTLSAQPADAYPEVRVPGADKIVHFGLYAPLGAALCHALGGRAGLAAVAGAVYGATDELHQAFVPGRSPDPLDVLADALGAVAGALLFARWRHRSRHGGVG